MIARPARQEPLWLHSASQLSRCPRGGTPCPLGKDCTMRQAGARHSGHSTWPAKASRTMEREQDSAGGTSVGTMQGSPLAPRGSSREGPRVRSARPARALSLAPEMPDGAESPGGAANTTRVGQRENTEGGKTARKSPDDPRFGFPTPLAGFGFPASNRRGLVTGYSSRTLEQEKCVTKTQQFSGVMGLHIRNGGAGTARAHHRQPRPVGPRLRALG